MEEDNTAPAKASSRFKFEGVEYEFRGLRLKEAIDIQKVTGYTIGQFEERVTEGDVVCIAALIYIMQKRSNPTIRFEDVDGDMESFDIIEEEDESESESGEDAGEGKEEQPAVAEVESTATL